MDLFSAYMLSLAMIGTVGLVKLVLKQPPKNTLSTSTNILKKIKACNNEDGISLTRNLTIKFSEAEKGVLLVAPSSKGKTTRFFKHIIKSIHKGSIVMTEPSGKVEKSLTKEGYETLKFSPFDVQNSIGWDIFSNCKDTYELRNIFRLLLETGFTVNSKKSDVNSQKEWLIISESLLMSYAIMNYHTKKYNTYQFIDNLLSKPIFAYPKNLNNDSDEANTNSLEFEIYASKDVEAIKEFKQFRQCRNEGESIIVSVRTILSASFRLFTIPILEDFMKLPNFDIKRLREDNILLYIEIPEQYVNDFKPLTATFIQQIINMTFVYKNDDAEIPVTLLLDELGNIGELLNLPSTITQCRKYHVILIGGLQSIQQLYCLYGERETELLLDAFQTKLVTGGLTSSSDYFSKLIGNTKKTDEKGNVTFEPIYSSEELRQLKDDDVIIINGSNRPVIDRLLKFLPNQQNMVC